MLMTFILLIQLKILSLLSGMGTLLLNVEGVKSLLIELVERRTRCNGELDKMDQKLSKNEIQVLCLLLEVSSLTISNNFCFCAAMHLLSSVLVCDLPF